MKRISLGTAVLAAVTMAGAGVATAQEPRPQGGSAAGQQPPAADRGAASDRDTSSASTFIKDMAVDGMAEVQLGKMAAERAASADVKEFGQRMVKDHTQASNELKQVASKMNVTIPTTLDQKHQQLVDKLSKLQGEQFDQAYMNAMVEGHEQVVSKLESRAGRQSTSNQAPGDRSQPAATAGTETGNRPSAGGQSVGTSGASQGEAALNQWASKTLPVVQDHLEKAKELQRETAR